VPTKTDSDRILACLIRHPGWSSCRVAKSLGVLTGTVDVVKASSPQPPTEAPPEQNNFASMVSIDKIVTRYDIKSAILRELSKIPMGTLVEESEFCKRTAGSDRNRFRRTVENNPELFKRNRVKVRLKDGEEGRWWWGRDTDIDKVIAIMEQ
jgi:hypothetical protein